MVREKAGAKGAGVEAGARNVRAPGEERDVYKRQDGQTVVIQVFGKGHIHILFEKSHKMRRTEIQKPGCI